MLIKLFQVLNGYFSITICAVRHSFIIYSYVWEKISDILKKKKNVIWKYRWFATLFWVLLNWETKTKWNETKRKEVSQNETKYIKQSIKDPKTINEGVKINDIWVVSSAIYRSTQACSSLSATPVVLPIDKSWWKSKSVVKNAREERQMVTKSWSFAKPISRNGQLIHDGVHTIYGVMTLT